MASKEIIAHVLSVQTLLLLVWSAVIAGIIQVYPLLSSGKVNWPLALATFLAAFAAYIAQNIQQAAGEKRIVERLSKAV